MKKLILTLFVFATGYCLQAQDITTANIRWNATSSLNAQTGVLDETACAIVTNTHTSVQIVDANGSARYSLTVDGVIGQWSDMSAIGEIAYRVHDADDRGTIRFVRNSDGLKIFLALVSDNQEMKNFDFTISDFALTDGN